MALSPDMEKALETYIDLDFLDPLSSPRQKFLIDIAKQLPEKDDYYDDLPDRYRVINCLESVYPKVSEETQKKIDELGVIEAAKQ